MSPTHHHMDHKMEEMNTTGFDTTVPSTIASLLQSTLTTMMSHGMHHHHHATPGTGHSMVLSENVATPDSLGISDHSEHGSMTHSVEHGAVGEDHMMMYFHSSLNAVILFKEWSVSTMHGLVGSVILIFVLAMLYEGIKFFREYLFKKHFTSLEYSSVAVLGDDGKTVTEVHRVARNRMLSWPHLVQTTLHIVQMVLSYFLMLIFMTFNVWLCLGVVLGSGAGYFLFGWKKATVIDITEHCH